MIQLGQQLREIAEKQPPPVIHIGLFDQARRRSRRRIATAGVIAATAATAGILMAVGKLQPPTQTSSPVPAGSLDDLVKAGAGGPLGWIVLAIVLAVLCLVWRRLPLGLLARRLTAVAVAGALIVLASPPGTTLWGEPRGRIGLPDRLAEPDSWVWAADLKQSPPGQVALVFSGPATHGGLEEGRLALLAADGDRYRVFDVFADPLEWSSYSGLGRRSPVLSPNGRYLYSADGTFDLTTGRQLTDGLLSVRPAAWSADSHRIVRLVYQDSSAMAPAWQIWDLPSQRMLREIPAGSAAQSAEMALSPTGDELAVEQGDNIVIFPADGGPPASWPHNGWRLADTHAWNPDGTLLAMIRDDCNECDAATPLSRRIQLVDPQKGSIVDGGIFQRFPARTTLLVQGWRSPSELVVQVNNAVEVFARGNPTPARLLTLPPGIDRIEIASDRLSDPIRPAGPATYGPPNNVCWLILGVACVPVGLVLGVWILIRRIRRKGRRSGPSARQ